MALSYYLHYSRANRDSLTTRIYELTKLILFHNPTHLTICFRNYLDDDGGVVNAEDFFDIGEDDLIREDPEVRALTFLTDMDGVDFDCAICLGDQKVNGGEEEEEIAAMPCSHAFHAECILEWLSIADTCPLCRHLLPSEPDPYTWPPPTGLRFVPTFHLFEFRSFFPFMGILVFVRGYDLKPYDDDYFN